MLNFLRKSSATKDLIIAESTNEEVKCFFENLGSITKLATNKINLVKVPVQFGGYGYVEGRSKGLIINKNLILVEADCDLGWNSVCLLLKEIPILVYELNCQHKPETVIFDITNNKKYTIINYNLSELPEKIKIITHDVISCYIDKLKEIKNLQSINMQEQRKYINDLINSY